ncbi:Snake venom metalloprotease inhibitor 02D01 [Merluccius polli]|uniref:Snake venom metalloprotease inhibitor 02D01 n=1 Tax=Merluccius polli TaxID=89951 RepID=A0AA47NU51_MERPO|nr:Snake venom metalloprotease inhibitor 02D01 [Merluccius polli]
MVAARPLRDNGTHPRFGPLGTRNGATIPTSPHSVVKQIIGRASEWDTMVIMSQPGSESTGVIHPGSSQRHHLPQSDNPRSLQSHGQILACPAGKVQTGPPQDRLLEDPIQGVHLLPPLFPQQVPYSKNTFIKSRQRRCAHIRPKKKRDGASICVIFINLDLTRAPCAETPSRLAMADFFDLRESNSPRFTVESAKICSSTTCVSRSFMDRHTVTLSTCHCFSSCFTRHTVNQSPRSHRRTTRGGRPHRSRKTRPRGNNRSAPHGYRGSTRGWISPRSHRSSSGWISPRSHRSGSGWISPRSHRSGSGWISPRSHRSGSGWISPRSHRSGSGWISPRSHRSGSGWVSPRSHRSGSGWVSPPSHRSGSGWISPRSRSSSSGWVSPRSRSSSSEWVSPRSSPPRSATPRARADQMPLCPTTKTFHRFGGNGNGDWTVTNTSSNVCALRGSTHHLQLRIP